MNNQLVQRINFALSQCKRCHKTFKKNKALLECPLYSYHYQFINLLFQLRHKNIVKLKKLKVVESIVEQKKEEAIER